MAISIAQQVDLLYKQAFGVTKTDTANNKSPSNESIPSPLLIRGDTLWAQSDQIPAIAAATPGVVQAYTGASAVQMSADTTTVPVGGIYPTWLTNLTYWIPQEFGATYNIKIYIDNPGVANPTVTGTQIFAAGSGGTGEFYYNYQSGVLNFIGGTIPAALTSGKVLYAVGYRYIGKLGVTDLPSNLTIGNMNFNDTTISTITGNANLILSPNGTGQVTTTASFTTSENVYANFGFFTSNVTASNFISNNTIEADGDITSNANIYAEYIIANVDLLGVNVNASGDITGVSLNANTDLFVGGNANIGSGFAVFDSDNQELVIDGSIIPANAGYSLGNATNPWSGLYISGETIYIGNSTIKSNNTSNTLYFTNPTGANVAITGNSTSTTLSTVNLSANGNLSANFVNATSNVLANFINANANIYSNNVIVNLELSGNTANFSGNIIVPNLTVNLELAGNTANFSGNIKSLNANLGNLAEANFVNVASNLTVNLELAGNTANFSGNIKSLNANLGNLAEANFVQTGLVFNGNSNVSIAANGNVGVSVTGLQNVVVVSNLGANVVGYIQANGEIAGGSFKGISLTSNVGNILVQSEQSGNSYVQLRAHGDGTIDVGNARISSLATPTASTDAATKQYVDDVAQGLHVHAPSLAATPDTLANVTSGTITYDNGTAGVGATLTTTGSFNLIDGVNVQTSGTRILVKNEVNTAHNGIYTWTNATVITRAVDFNTPTEMAGGDFTFVQQGTLYNDTGWVMTEPVVTVGTSPVLFVQFSGAGTYTAGAGLTLTGTVFSVNVDNITTAISGGNVVVKANAQFTTPNIDAATGTSLDLTGNVLAGNINSNAKVTAVDIEVSSNIVTNNLTVNLDLDGSTANFSGLVDIFDFNASNTANLGNVANVTITGGSNGQFLQTDGNGVLTFATVDTSIIANGNSNVSIPVANGNIVMSVAGNANIFTVTGTGANISGSLGVTLDISGNTANFSGNINSALNANLGNLVTANYVNAAQNVNATNNINVGNTVISNNVTVNLNLAGNTANFTGNVEVNNLDVNLALTGATANFTGNVEVNNLDVNLELTGATANFSGNVIVPNLAVNLELDGNTANFNSATVIDFVASNTANLGNVGNVTITGGSANQFLQTNGSGALTWATVDSSIIKNGTSNLSIPVADGNIEMSVAGNANIVVVTATGANVNGYLTVSQTLNGNIGSFSSGITGQNVYSNTTIDAVGNITGGNIKGNADVVAGSNVVGASLYANYIYANATANILGDFRANANASVGLNLAGNTANFTGNVEVNNLDVNLALTGATANFTGNVEVNNLDVNLELTGNTANFSGNVIVPNLTVNLELDGNTANFNSANISDLNVANTANLGNVGNITITGGSNGQFLQTNGSGVVTWATVDTSIIANGNSNVSIPVANGNIEMSVGGVADLFVISTTGANITGNLGVSDSTTTANLTVNLELGGNTANFTGNVQVNNLDVNLALTGATANFTGNVEVNNLDVNLELTGNTANFTGNVQVNNLDVNLQLDGNTANFTGNISAANAGLGNLVTANYVNVASNTITSNLTVNLELAGNTANFSTSVQTPLINNGNSNIGITANGNIAISSAGTTNVFVVSSGGANITGNLGVSGNFSVGSLTATNLKANSNVEVGNTTITWGTVTTTAVTANQTIAQFPVSGFAGVQFLVRGVDSTGSKYSVATVQAVTDGANVDYAIYGGVGLGGTTGTLAVNISGSNIALQVTPSSSNSTVWTTQYKLV